MVARNERCGKFNFFFYKLYTIQIIFLKKWLTIVCFEVELQKLKGTNEKKLLDTSVYYHQVSTRSIVKDAFNIGKTRDGNEAVLETLENLQDTIKNLNSELKSQAVENHETRQMVQALFEKNKKNNYVDLVTDDVRLQLFYTYAYSRVTVEKKNFKVEMYNISLLFLKTVVDSFFAFKKITIYICTLCIYLGSIISGEAQKKKNTRQFLFLPI